MAKFNNAILQLLLHQTNNTVSDRNVMYRTENTWEKDMSALF